MRKKCGASSKGKEKKSTPEGKSKKRKAPSEDSSDDFEDRPKTKKSKAVKNVNESSTSKVKNIPKAVGAKEKPLEGQMTYKEWAKERKKTKGKLSMYKPLDTRSSPGKLVEAIEDLKKLKNNGEKMKTLEYIGFSSLLDLGLQKQPLCLCSWLLEHFDENKCSIEFPDGRSIEITEVDVHRCLGVPIGGESLVLKGQTENSDVLAKWRTQFTVGYSALRPRHVRAAMVNRAGGGLEFVQNFLVIFDTALVNSQTSGCVTQNLVRSLDSVETVRKYNWCEYVLTSLTTSKLKLGDDIEGTFTGPSLLLVLLYLDMVVHRGHRKIPRNIPAFKGWTDQLVREREKNEMDSGGFGKGRIESDRMVNLIPKPLTTTQDYYQDLVTSAIEMSRMMREFVQKLNQVPMALRQEGPIVSCYELGKTIMGRGYPESTGLDDVVSTQVESVLTQGTPAEYKHPGFVKNMKMIENAINERDELLAERNRWPNFNLNVTGLDRDVRDPVEEVIEQLNHDYANFNEDIRVNGGEENSSVRLDEVEVATETIDADIVGGSGGKENDDTIAAEMLVQTPTVASKSNTLTKKVYGRMFDVDEASLSLDKTTSIEGNALGPVENKDRSVDKVKEGEEIADNSVIIVANKDVTKAKDTPAMGGGGLVETKTPRQKRGVKPTISGKSPYMCRLVDPEKRNSKEQTLIVSVIKELKHNKILFDHKQKKSDPLLKYDIWVEDCQSLIDNVVTSQVMDVWALRLNHEELKRSPDSPFVYFVPSSVAGLTVGVRTKKTFAERLKEFKNSFMEAAVNGHLNIHEVDMVIFPLTDDDHHFLICLHLKKGIAEILDSSKSRASDYEGVFKKCFDNLKLMFGKHLQSVGAPLLGQIVLNIPNARVLQLEWQNDRDTDDSGVYAMRHMETYKGDVSWKCGFKASSQKNIKSLSAKYMHCILTSDLNADKDALLRLFKLGAETVDKCALDYTGPEAERLH